MKKIFITVLFLLIAVSCENKREKVQRDGEPDVVLVETEDNEMNTAIESAKKTFKSDFHQALLSKNPNFSNFTIKQNDGCKLLGSGYITRNTTPRGHDLMGVCLRPALQSPLQYYLRESQLFLHDRG